MIDNTVRPSIRYLAQLNKASGAPSGYVRLYRAVSQIEHDTWINTGKLLLITGEKFFTTDIRYINRIKGEIHKGKRVFKDRKISHVISIDVPLVYFDGKLAKKGSPNLPIEFKSLPSFKAGNKSLIQVKCEKGCINLGFFSQERLNEIVSYL